MPETYTQQTQFSIAAVPKYWGLLMGKLIGTKAADKLLLTGKLVSPAEVQRNASGLCVCVSPLFFLTETC